MASKLLIKIAPNTPMPAYLLGALKDWNDRYHPGESPLNRASNRKWRRIEKRVQKQLINSTWNNTIKLIAPDDREDIVEDFKDFIASYGEEKALNYLREYICANFIYGQLIKHNVDFFAQVKSKRPINLISELIKLVQEIKLRVKELLKQLHQSNRFKIIRPAMLLPQRSPNAPNFLPALSLEVA